MTGLGSEPGSLLFPAAVRKSGKQSRRPLACTDAGDMLKRLKQAGLPAHYSPHSFRATGITNFLQNDGTLEAAQRIAGHADSRITKLYLRPARTQIAQRGFEANARDENMPRDQVFISYSHKDKGWLKSKRLTNCTVDAYL